MDHQPVPTRLNPMLIISNGSIGVITQFHHRPQIQVDYHRLSQSVFLGFDQPEQDRRTKEAKAKVQQSHL